MSKTHGQLLIKIIASDLNTTDRPLAMQALRMTKDLHRNKYIRKVATKLLEIQEAK